MFERYTEQARRAIFYARFEASAMGTPYIEGYQLLLGVLRADAALAALFFGDGDQLEALRQEFRPGGGRRGVSTSVDLPLSHESQRALAYSAEEAERMRSREITTAHLLLGVMRTQDGPTLEALARRGLSADACRRKLAERFVPVTADHQDSPHGQADLRDALREALIGRKVHLEPEHIFTGVDFELAGNAAGAAHTIYQILRHVTYWQETCIAYVRGGRPPWPEHAAESWPGPTAPDETEWLTALERFLLTLDELVTLIGHCDLAAAPGEQTNLQAIQATAQHNSHHLGQVIVLRQLLGAWPPPGGGLTW